MSHTGYWDIRLNDYTKDPLDDVAEWLGFEGQNEYNFWCERCTPEEFAQRLRDSK